MPDGGSPLPSSLKERLSALLRALEGEWTRTCELAACTGCTTGHALNVLVELQQDGVAERQFAGNSFRWRLRGAA